MESAILFGNGLNRIAGNNAISWEGLLKELYKASSLPTDSNTLNYECIYLDICKDLENFKSGSVVETEYDLKCKIAKACNKFNSGLIYEELAHLPVQVYLTTNYDGVLDRTLVDLGYKYDKDKSCKTEAIYSIRRCHAYKDIHSGDYKKIFPIHGECAAPKSIMIGYDHYCGSLGKLDDFFKGNYTYGPKDQLTKLPRLLDRLSENGGINNMGAYWPDYFFTHNIHIIGLGLQLVETDLWWMLNKRARFKQFNNLIENEIFFYGDPDDSITKLLETFGVEVVRVKVVEPKEQKSWNEAYRTMFDEMKKNI